jgi:hypothetical protein
MEVLPAGAALGPAFFPFQDTSLLMASAWLFGSSGDFDMSLFYPAFPISNGSYPTGASICPARGFRRSPKRARFSLLRGSRVRRHRRLFSLTACDTLLPRQITAFTRLRHTPLPLPVTPTHFSQHPKVILAPDASGQCAPALPPIRPWALPPQPSERSGAGHASPAWPLF